MLLILSTREAKGKSLFGGGHNNLKVFPMFVVKVLWEETDWPICLSQLLYKAIQ